MKVNNPPPKPDESFLLNLVKIIRDHPPAKAAVMVNAVFDGIFDDVPESGCDKGCSWCCYSRVDVTELEMKAIEAHIRHRFTGLQVDTVIERARSIKSKYKKLTKDERIFSRDACPLLFEGKCSVYSSRPLMCRSIYSRSDMLCKAAHTDPDTIVPIFVEPKKFASEMIAAILIGENKKEYELTIVDGLLKTFK